MSDSIQYKSEFCANDMIQERTVNPSTTMVTGQTERK